MDTKLSWFQKHALLGYFLLAFAISWAIGIPLALIAQGKLNWHLLFICTIYTRMAQCWPP